MRVGNLEANPGEHVFGYLETAASRSGLRPDIPVHLFAGAEPGPTLLVQGAIHGGEVIGSIAILNFIGNL
ncbi:MAG: succinylglutamate desuccinylase, partial [Chloroflexi bacterium]|nr:succinylglutamate desuccinylase [Chloroflexota bacterium]